MHLRVVVFLVFAALAASPANAQTDPGLWTPDSETSGLTAPPTEAADAASPDVEDSLQLEPAIPRALPSRSDVRDRGSFAQAIGRDFRNFFTNVDTAKMIGVMGTGALVASQWDGGARTAGARWSDEAFEPGTLAGNFLTHVAAGGGTWLLGRATGNQRIAALGNDVIRAQILSQTVVQAAKFATNRSRPDGSNNHSLPSGHTATAFATAGVVQRHFGWKAGIPAYAFAGYIGASRIAADRHYLSDVIMGAGIGIAAAHTVTINVGTQRFAMGVAPAQGGAAVMFTRR